MCFKLKENPMTPVTATSFRFQKRINLGNFEHEEVEVFFSVEEGKDLLSEMKRIKCLAAEALYARLNVQQTGNTAQTQENTHGNGQKSNEESHQESSKESSSEGKSEKPVSKKNSKKSVKTTEEVASPAASSTEEEMEEVESPFTKVTEEIAAPKTSKAKNEVYSRANERHIDILTSFLGQLTGGEAWKQHPNITQFSISLVGKEFIDAEGNVVPEFVQTCKDFFTKKANGL